MRSTRLLFIAMALPLAIAAGARNAAAQGTARARVRIEVVQPAISMQAVQRVVARAAADSVPPPSRTLPAGASLTKRDHMEIVASPVLAPSRPKRRRTVRVVTLAYTAN